MLQLYRLYLSSPLHCRQVLQLILVHVVVWVSHYGLVDALQQPAALTQSHQQTLLNTDKVISSKYITNVHT